MSRFTKNTEGAPKVINHMGAPAFAHTPEVELISILLNSMVQDTYYTSTDKTLQRVKELLGSVDPLTAAKIAVYARNEFGMRSISHVVAAELAKYASGQPWAKGFYDSIVRRTDDMMEIIAYYYSVNGKGASLPKALVGGFKRAFDRMDAYKLAKYKFTGKDVNLIDVVKLVNPAPSDSVPDVEVDKAAYIEQAQNKANWALSKKLKENAATWSDKVARAKKTRKSTVAIHPLEALLLNLLPPAETWETKISAAGQEGSAKDVATAKAEAWEELLASKRIGALALVRNLRNIIQQAPAQVPVACELLRNERFITTKQLIFPFQFLSAYAEIEKLKKGGATFESENKNVNAVLAALEVAVTHSVKNLPTLMGRTLILSDNSGSMHGDRGGKSVVSANSNVKTADIANLFATLYWMKADDTMVGLFGDRLLRPALNRNAGVFENYKTVATTGGQVGGGTETGIFHMFEELIKNKTHVDTIVVFSDCQIGTGCAWYSTGGKLRGHDFNKLYEEYKKINPNVRCYSVDLQHDGSTVFGGSVIKIFGWSDKIFDIMKRMEHDKTKLLQIILDSVEFHGEQTQASLFGPKATTKKVAKKTTAKTPAKKTAGKSKGGLMTALRAGRNR